MSKKSQSIQKEFRNTVFQYHQYWSIAYTEKYADGSEKDFTTFIKAKSYALAKHLLVARLKESDPQVKIKSIQGFMMHKDFKPRIKNKLGVKEWEQIRSASFPNIHNVIFKHETPRPEGYSNRFNRTNHDHIKTIGFKKGESNWSAVHRKGKVRAQEDRVDYIYKGKWVKWDKALKEHTLQKILEALGKHHNNRSRAAKSLGYSRHKFYSLMGKFPEINWAKDYPPPVSVPPKIPSAQRSATQKRIMAERMKSGEIPFSHITAAQEVKRRANIAATHKKQRKERLDHWEPRIREALSECNNSRREAAGLLGIKYSYLFRLMGQLRHGVNWSREYPNCFSRPQK